MSTRKTDGQGREFDENEALREAEAWDHIEPLDTNEEICFVEGARWQFNAHKAALDRLDEAEKQIERLVEFAKEIKNTTSKSPWHLVGHFQIRAEETLELISKWKGQTNV